jgi:hypothetical protein
VVDARARLSPGGHFVFQLMVDDAGLHPDPPANHPYGLRFYTRADVEAELLAAGFTTVTRRMLDGAADDGSAESGDVVFCAACSP